MREAENEGAHIWLRQSATFSVNGQTRTVEIAIPLRPGATAEELELLLSEADTGMERLTRHLDGRVAAIAAESTAPAASPAAPAARANAAQAAGRAQAPDSAPPAAPRPTGSSQPTPTASTSPAARRDVPPTPQTPQTPPPTPLAPATPNRGGASGALGPAAAVPSGPDISRPEFIKAAGELGLDVRQAMQRLGVRSLEGLNLRESLEVLRRQALRGDEPASPAPSRQSPPAPPAPPTAAPARPVMSAPAAIPPAASYAFEEEEDEPELTFTIDGDEDLPEDFGGYGEANGTSALGGTTEDDYDELDELDDVPDFAPPAASSASGRRAPASLPAAKARQAPQAEPEPGPVSEPASVAAELIARLRAATPGGVMSSQQRTAYRNIVANELGETRAAGLVRGIWNVTPERLGAEQADELLSWGKRDTFADEATQVLAELRAERERAAERATGNGASAAEPAQRPGARGRPASRRGAEGGDL